MQPSPKKFCDGDPSKAANFYHRYRSDILDVKKLGLKSFRFSIAWTRIFPNGPTEVCQAGLDYYDDMINALLEADIVPLFDLFHSDLPYWVIEMGGIINPDFVEWFGDYARVCFEHFGDRVDYWSTKNEPSINVMASYAYGTNAPFLTDMGLAIKACHNALLAHYRAVKIYKDMGLTGKIGAVIHVQPTYSLSFEPKDIHAMDHDFAFYAGGYKFIFGLIQVDFETKERYRRDSWYYYQKVIANGMVD